MLYLNIKDSKGVETVDELNQKDFNSTKEFRLELMRLVREYHMANIPVYISSRCDRSWNKN